MGGFTLDPEELRKLKVTLEDASEALGLRDFTRVASLEGSLKIQTVGRYENVEETVDGVVKALTKFVDQDYAATTKAMQEFINSVHTTLEAAVDRVHRTRQDYVKTDDDAADGLPRLKGS